MSSQAGRHVVVIGAGVIGICCALTLRQAGFQVTVVERDTPGDSSAAASCGFIAVSEVIPLSRPGMLLKAPGWLLDPTGPLTLRAASLPAILPWFLRFAGNARPSRIQEISAALARLTDSAHEDYEALLNPLGLGTLIGGVPVLELYDTEEELIRERPFHKRRRELGFQVDEISGREAAEMEPGLAKDFAKAAVFRDWRSVVDGKGFVQAMFEKFVADGGSYRRGEVTGFTRDDSRVSGLRLAAGGTLEGDQFVVAAGVWSKRLAREVGAKIVMEGVMGYQTTLSDPGVALGRGVVYAKGGFGITPYQSGLAIGGSIEFAGLSARPNWRRAEVLVNQARRVLPGLRTQGGTRRIGRRPLTPDALPVIDRAPGAANVLIATGHGQLGVTLGATTGKLIAALAAGRRPDIDLAPHRATRF